MEKSCNIITIDGPSGAGKGTVANKVAARLGYSYLDTGSMYRTVALAVKKAGIDINNGQQLNSVLRDCDIRLINRGNGQPGIILNGEDVTSDIRTSDITTLSSSIARIKTVRDFLVKKQKEIAQKGDIVVEGRDMGTYVFPHAKYKFYLDASVEVRAIRRHKQLEMQGVSPGLEQVKSELIERDRQDMERDESPLHPASNAVIIDTTELTISEVVDLIVSEVIKRG